jgi:exodeoxyribonuclease V alpha subunit
MAEIRGYIERITFQNPETGYTIAQLKEANRSRPSCIVGHLPALQPGETVRCSGEWTQHMVYGPQFVVDVYHVEAPADVIGIKKYLGSGLIKGIGHVYAARIVKLFDVDTLNIIEHSPEKLLLVKGLKKKRLEQIKRCWAEQKSIREVMIFLQGYGVSPAYAQKIFKTYGEQSIEKVKENPFYLARDIFGIGFKIADTIAQKLGIPKEAPVRIEAGIEYVLSELANDGNVCCPLEDFLTEAEAILETSKALIQECLATLYQENRIELQEMVSEGKMQPFIWLKMLFLAETGIHRHITRLHQYPCALRQVDTNRALEWVQEKLTIQLADNQKEAVTQAFNEKIQIITGGPGTGKSTITKAIIAVAEKLTSKIILAAPTGRAAKRMTEITGKKASTIHSLLEFDFKAGGFKRGVDHPLDCDLLIVDEASMIDTQLMHSLLKAVPDHARVIFVGDINQLPSVGPGNVLKDMIASRRLPVTSLNEIFRQAAGSRIITNAHKINKGHLPDTRNFSDSDFFFLEVEDVEDILRNIVALVTQRLPKKFGFDPIDDIQVLAPMKRGVIGIENLNMVLQQALNTKENALIRSGRKFLPGDKVIQTRNDYKREVYNGDIGRISQVNLVEQQVKVIIDEREIAYDFNNLDELVLAYAVSIHKYQGSECPCVVMPVHTTHFKLLHRNLLYTGVTRGKRLVVLVGSLKALYIAVHNDEVKKRYTGLQQALAGAFQTNLMRAI